MKLYIMRRYGSDAVTQVEVIKETPKTFEVAPESAQSVYGVDPFYLPARILKDGRYKIFRSLLDAQQYRLKRLTDKLAQARLEVGVAQRQIEDLQAHMAQEQANTEAASDAAA